MSLERKVCFYTKTSKSEKLNIFLDNKPVKAKDSKYILDVEIGNHTIRIEQYKMVKSKYYWILCPIFFLLSLFSGDSEFDGKTPFYAVYEADVYVNRDIEINVELLHVNRNLKKSKRGFQYKIDVNFPNGVEVKVIRDEFTATSKEKKKWFLYFAILWTSIFSFLTIIFMFLGANDIRIGSGVSSRMLWGGLSVLSIIGWDFFIRKYYKWSKGEY